MPVLNGSSNKIRGNDEVVGYELRGNKALFMKHTNWFITELTIN